MLLPRLASTLLQNTSQLTKLEFPTTEPKK